MKNIFSKCLFLFFFLVLGTQLAHASIVQVTSEEDSFIDDKICSLREAVVSVQTKHGLFGCQYSLSGEGPLDTVRLESKTYKLTSVSGWFHGNIELYKDINIRGEGVGKTIIDGNGTSRIFNIQSGVIAKVANLSLQNGKTKDPIWGGGAILVNEGAKLTLEDAFLERNSSSHEGGAISNRGDLSVIRSTFDKNWVTGDTVGGAIYNAKGTTIMEDTTLSNNQAAYGAGFYNFNGTARMTNVTIARNFATSNGGGVINFNGKMEANNVTISYNTAGTDTLGEGGGVSSSGGSFKIQNSLIAGNLGRSSLADCSGTLISLGHNLVGPITPASGDFCNLVASTETGDPSPVGDLLNIVLPYLDGDLNENGGSTPTIALLSGGPALNAGGKGTCAKTDQRGVSRPIDGSCDIGAYQKSLGDVSPKPVEKAPEKVSDPTVSPSTEEKAPEKKLDTNENSAEAIPVGETNAKFTNNLTGGCSLGGNGSLQTNFFQIVLVLFFMSGMVVLRKNKEGK